MRPGEDDDQSVHKAPPRSGRGLFRAPLCCNFLSPQVVRGRHSLPPPRDLTFRLHAHRQRDGARTSCRTRYAWPREDQYGSGPTLILPAAFSLAGLTVALEKVGRSLPGLAVTALIAAVATISAPRLGISPVPVALLLGTLLAGKLDTDRLAPGIAHSAKAILRIGVALLGAQVTFGEIAGLGWQTVLFTVAALLLSLASGVVIGRACKLPTDMAILTSSAVAICGASATLAVAAALPKNRELDQSSAVVIACITIVGTGAMLAYPVIARLAGLDEVSAGIFIGASLHEVVQAVGGGFAFSSLAGETATTVKLIRVACLAPVVVAIGYWFAPGRTASGNGPPAVPLFLLGFVAMATLASSHLLGPGLTQALGQISRFLLTIAMVALGLKISLPCLVRAGQLPILAVTGQSALIATIAFGGALLIRSCTFTQESTVTAYAPGQPRQPARRSGPVPTQAGRFLALQLGPPITRPRRLKSNGKLYEAYDCRLGASLTRSTCTPTREI